MIARVVLVGRVVGIRAPRAAAGIALVTTVVVASKVLTVVAWAEVEACSGLVCCLGHEGRRIGGEEGR